MQTKKIENYLDKLEKIHEDFLQEVQKSHELKHADFVAGSLNNIIQELLDWKSDKIMSGNYQGVGKDGKTKDDKR